jgi:hypothetical protein
LSLLFVIRLKVENIPALIRGSGLINRNRILNVRLTGSKTGLISKTSAIKFSPGIASSHKTALMPCVIEPEKRSGTKVSTTRAERSPIT